MSLKDFGLGKESFPQTTKEKKLQELQTTADILKIGV